jgi:hypothetical protein
LLTNLFKLKASELIEAEQYKVEVNDQEGILSYIVARRVALLGDGPSLLLPYQ